MTDKGDPAAADHGLSVPFTAVASGMLTEVEGSACADAAAAVAGGMQPRLADCVTLIQVVQRLLAGGPGVAAAERERVARKMESSIVPAPERYSHWPCTCLEGTECFPHACHRAMNEAIAGCDGDTWPVIVAGATWDAVEPLIWREAARIARRPPGRASHRAAGRSRPEDTATASPVEIVSFGYGYGAAPPAHITVDLRGHFKDPHVDPSLRPLTAEDPRVVRAVLSTPGIPGLVDAIGDAVRAYRAGPAPGPVTVATGCVGGRHRGAAVAIELARRVGRDGIPVTLTHRDMARPVIERPAAQDPGEG